MLLECLLCCPTIVTRHVAVFAADTLMPLIDYFDAYAMLCLIRHVADVRHY